MSDRVERRHRPPAAAPRADGARGAPLVLPERPLPGAPRDYHFPAFQREVLANGLRIISANVPGRPLLVAQLLVRGEGSSGAAGEPASQGGVTVLMARAMTEGTLRRDAVALIEASERLGAELSADAGWDTLSVSIEVPRSRLTPALGLLAEVALEPSFPEDEIERLREERINDLLQARADPRRRVERLFPELVFADDAPYRRPLAGTEETVPGLDRAAIAARHAALLDPASSTLVVAGDLTGISLRDEVEAVFGGWRSPGGAAASPAAVSRGASAPRIVVVDRPGAPQSELRVGHLGVPRLNPDFHPLSVLNAILGGLFNSRLNQLLRETKRLHLRHQLELRHAPCGRALRGALRGADGGHGAGAAGHHVRAEAHPRGTGHATRSWTPHASTWWASSPCASRRPARSPVPSVAWWPWACPTTSSTAIARPSPRSPRSRCCESPRSASAPTRPRWPSSVTPTRFESALRDAGLGEVTVIRGEEVGEEA